LNPFSRTEQSSKQPFSLQITTIIMSDTGRKGMTDKLSEGVTPDSQKSTLDKTKETVTDAGDKVAGLATPRPSHRLTS
jgi:Heat shock protein 9/12